MFENTLIFKDVESWLVGFWKDMKAFLNFKDKEERLMGF